MVRFRVRPVGDPGRVLRRDGVYDLDADIDLSSCSEYMQHHRRGQSQTAKEVLYNIPKNVRCDMALNIYKSSLGTLVDYDEAIMAKAMLMTQCQRKHQIKDMNEIEHLRLDTPTPQGDLGKQYLLREKCKSLTKLYLQVVFDTYKNEFCKNSEVVNYAKRWIDVCPKKYHRHMKEVDNFHSKFSKFSS